MKKQILALGLILVLCVGLLPNNVLAVTGDATDAEEELVLETEETLDAESAVESAEDSSSEESGETVAAEDLAEEEEIAEEPSDEADLTQEEDATGDLTGESEEVPEPEPAEQEATNPDHDNWQPVSALVLNGSDKRSDGSYGVLAVDSEGNPYDLATGSLYLRDTTIVSARADIWPSQTNTLCYLDVNGAYQQRLLDAETVSALAQTFYYPGHVNDVISLVDLVNGQVIHFYYGNLTNGVSGLTECTQAKVLGVQENGATYYYLCPLDESGNAVAVEDIVSGSVCMYMAYDVLYSFEVEVKSIANEHTEDDGHVFLWLGDTYYVDKYYNMGNTASHYTNNTISNSDKENGYADEDVGVWAQLAKCREPRINELIKNGSDFKTVFADYNSVSYADLQAGKNGNSVTATDAFDNAMVYMLPEGMEPDSDWISMGAHSSEGGTRAWWYWINDYYYLSNYDDTLQYVQIGEHHHRRERAQDRRRERHAAVLDHRAHGAGGARRLLRLLRSEQKEEAEGKNLSSAISYSARERHPVRK